MNIVANLEDVVQLECGHADSHRLVVCLLRNDGIGISNMDRKTRNGMMLALSYEEARELHEVLEGLLLLQDCQADFATVAGGDL